MKIRLFYVVILVAGSLWGQGVRRGLSPVPPWAGPEGRIPEYYVYTDLKTGEYVLHHPDDLDALHKGEEPSTSEYVTVRFGRHLSKPTVDVEIEETPEGFEYRYTVSNALDARQEIRRFMIVTAGTDYTGVLEHQAEKPWTASPASPNMRPRFEQAAIPLLGMSNKGMLVWWSGTAQNDVIGPGQVRDGFVLKSEFRPGWTTAYAAGGKSLGAPGHGYPQVIVAQLNLVTGPAKEYRRVLTVGPRFPKDAPVETVRTTGRV